MRNGTAKVARRRAPKVKKDGADERQKQTQVRMTDSLKGRIRKFMEETRQETGFKISFSVAVRVLIEKGLGAS
jgi:hypothetical protein